MVVNLPLVVIPFVVNLCILPCMVVEKHYYHGSKSHIIVYARALTDSDIIPWQFLQANMGFRIYGMD